MRNVLDEMRQGMTGLKEIYPQLVDLYGQWGPKMAEAEESTARARAKAQIAGVNELSPSLRAALDAANPEMKLARDRIYGQLESMGPSQIEQELTRQAMADLSLGGKLSAEQTRDSEQASRAAMQARGLSRGLPAAVLEVMNREGASQARLDARRGFAGAVDAYAQNREVSDRAFSQSALNTLNAVYDPFQRIYGSGGSQVSGMTGGQNVYNPFLSAAQDVGRSNQEAQLSWNIAQMQEEGQNARFKDQLAYNQWEFGQNMQYSRDASQKASNASLWGSAITGVALLAAAFL